MHINKKVLESNVPFAQSIIWQLNRSYYQEAGISAWSGGEVPHNMTSSAFVGKTYAGLILGMLRDIAHDNRSENSPLVSSSPNDSQNDEKVYIIELGAGHGRLGFHILQQLDHMIAMEQMELPDYCLVLTDIVEGNLKFFKDHPQLQTYIQQGKLDIAYFDGIDSKNILLRNSGVMITPQKLKYPIIALANYFFDTLPNDLYKIDGDNLTSCNMTILSDENSETASSKQMLETLSTTIQESENGYEKQSEFVSGLLEEYTSALSDSYLLLPNIGMECISTLKAFSKKGLMLISMDKGFVKMSNLEKKPKPEIITHGSFSLYVNFHALKRFCDSSNGKTFFATFSDFSLKMGCLLFLDDAESYTEISKAYENHVNDFGPDDFVGMKDLLMKNGESLNLRELISCLRMGYYDSTLFIQLLPFIKSHLANHSVEEHTRLAETLVKIGTGYFTINEPIDTTYEVGGLLYDLGFFREALHFFELTAYVSGELADLYYNRVLCHYQLRHDTEFATTLAEAKLAFPDFEGFVSLGELDMDAV